MFTELIIILTSCQTLPGALPELFQIIYIIYKVQSLNPYNNPIIRSCYPRFTGEETGLERVGNGVELGVAQHPWPILAARNELWMEGSTPEHLTGETFNLRVVVQHD